jgi:hypothetical protein
LARLTRSYSISFVLTFGLTHRGCMFPLAFVNTSQDWLILQISLASLKVAHMASHWRMTVDAAKFNTGGQWLEPRAHLKSVVANRVVEGSVIAMLNICEDLIPCMQMLGVTHVQDMHNYHVDHLRLSIYLGMKRS